MPRMGPSSGNAAKPFVRHGAVAVQLRRGIVGGRYAPGSQLPPNVELQRKFKTTPVTVQRAIDQLVAEGFVRTRPNFGTYVADHPSHLWRYALVFPDAPSSTGEW